MTGSTGPNEDEYGFYCGSDESIGYGTIESERKSANAYASFDFAFNDEPQLVRRRAAGLQQGRPDGRTPGLAPPASDGVPMATEGYFRNAASEDGASNIGRDDSPLRKRAAWTTR